MTTGEYTKEQEKYIREQLKYELLRNERAKKKRIKIARASFIEWMTWVIPFVGRSVGFRLTVFVKNSRKKIGKIYDWLFDIK